MAEQWLKCQRHEPRSVFTLDKFWKKSSKKKETEDDSEDSMHLSDSSSDSDCDADISQSESSIGQTESPTMSRSESLQALQGKAGEIDWSLYMFIQ